MNIQFEVNISEESSLRSWGTAFEEIESNLNILNNSCFEIKLRKNDVGPHQKTRIIESSNRYSNLEHFYLLLLLPSNIFIEFCNFLFIYLTTTKTIQYSDNSIGEISTIRHSTAVVYFVPTNFDSLIRSCFYWSNIIIFPLTSCFVYDRNQGYEHISSIRYPPEANQFPSIYWNINHFITPCIFMDN